MENDILNNLEINYNYLDSKFSETYPAGAKVDAPAKTLVARATKEIAAKKNYIIYTFLSITILLLYMRPNIIMTKCEKKGVVVKNVSILKLLIVSSVLSAAASFALIYFTK